jgi:hypothetical protein
MFYFIEMEVDVCFFQFVVMETHTHYETQKRTAGALFLLPCLSVSTYYEHFFVYPVPNITIAILDIIHRRVLNKRQDDG